MNKLFIIGRLTRDPELRHTDSGIPVCNFTVAVRKKSAAEHPEADFFRVKTWRGLADNCGKYLRKGSLCSIFGAVSAQAYTAKDGSIRAQMEVNADEVEFLSSSRQQEAEGQDATPRETGGGFVQVEDEELPF